MSLLFKYVRPAFVSALICAGSLDAAVVAWDSITTETTVGVTSVNPDNGYQYENNVTVVTTFSSGGATYAPLIDFPIPDFSFKSGPANTRVWYERNNISSAGNPTGYTGNALADLTNMFDTPLRINFGSDDSFRKTLDSIRFTGKDGVQINHPLALTGAGVSVLDRGANDDNFAVRVVTSVDTDGIALTYSPTVTIRGGDPFGTGVTSMHHALWDSATTDGVGPFNISDDLDRTQSIGGILLTFDEFGLDLGDRVFGYEIAVAGSGTRTGLDLLPSGAAFINDSLPEGALSVIPNPEPENGLMAMLIAMGLSAIWQRRRRPRPGTFLRS